MARSATYPQLRRRIGVGLALTAAVALLGGCGSPPRPLPTAPPRATASVSVPSAQVTALPTGLPTGLPTALPTGLPTFTLPTAGPPTFTLPPTTVPTPTRTTTPPPAPAPGCTAGPTDEQILAVVRGLPGIPADQQLTIDEGPYCAGDWQYATIGLVSDADSEPLLAVTRGKPASLQLVEAGTDVCSDVVQSTAPPGIRVLACGA